MAKDYEPEKISIRMDGRNPMGLILHALRKSAEELQESGHVRAALLAICAYRIVRQQQPENGFSDVYFTPRARSEWAREFVQIYGRNALLHAAEFRRMRIADGSFDMIRDWDDIHKRIKKIYREVYPTRPPVPQDYWWPAGNAHDNAPPGWSFHDEKCEYGSSLRSWHAEEDLPQNVVNRRRRHSKSAVQSIATGRTAINEAGAKSIHETS